MSEFLLKQMSSMHAMGLHSSVSILGSILTTMMKNNCELFDTQQQYDICIKQADSLQKSKEYLKAILTYERALVIEKHANNEGQKLSSQMVNIRFQIHLCYVELGNYHSAIEALYEIPNNLRTAEIHLASAKVYHKLNVIKAARHSYLEVLKICPLAIDAIFGLLEIGESLSNLLPLLAPVSSNVDWFMTWINAQAHLHSKDYNRAIQSYDVLNRKTRLSGNPFLLSSLAKTYMHSSDTKSAQHIFEMLHQNNPYHIQGMDLYAMILYDLGLKKKLDDLAYDLIRVSDEHAESYVALGYNALLKDDHKQAVSFATKAGKLNRSVQALLLKGLSFRKYWSSTDKSLENAAQHFREVIRLVPNFFRPYEEVVQCHLLSGRKREAVQVAEEAIERIGYRANTLTLCAIANLASSKSKAMVLVDKALSVNTNYLPAIKAKTKILYERGKYTEAMSFAMENIEIHPYSSMHVLVANCHLKMKNFAKSAEHFNIALRLQENCREAQNGLKRIEKLQRNNADTSADFEQESPDEDNSLSNSMIWSTGS